MKGGQGSVNREAGEAHRARLRELVVSRLFVGARIPAGGFLGKLLKLTPGQASVHMYRVLREDGIEYELRGNGPARRNYVTAIPGEEERDGEEAAGTAAQCAERAGSESIG